MMAIPLTCRLSVHWYIDHLIGQQDREKTDLILLLKVQNGEILTPLELRAALAMHYGRVYHSRN